MGTGKDLPSQVSMKKTTESMKRMNETLKIMVGIGLRKFSNFNENEIKEILDDPEMMELIHDVNSGVVKGTTQALDIVFRGICLGSIAIATVFIAIHFIFK